MTPRLRLGRGNAAELDDAMAEVDEAALIHKERLARLGELAKHPSVLARLGLKAGDVLVERVQGYKRPDRITRWSVVGTELERCGRGVEIVAVNIRTNGSLGCRTLSPYADVELETTESSQHAAIAKATGDGE